MKNKLNFLLKTFLIFSIIQIGTCYNHSINTYAETNRTGLLCSDETEINKHAIDISNTNGYANARSFPSKVDLSTTKYFPNIETQKFGSCAAFASTYYQFTYEVNKLNNTSAKDINNVYSPYSVYNYINSGVDNGSALDDAYDSLEHRGALKWNEFTSSQDYNIWPSNENQLLSALKTRLVSWNCLFLTTSDITNIKSGQLNGIKQALNDGKVLVVGVKCADDFSNISTTNTSNGYVITRLSDINNYHAMTIVGYDDSITVDVNKDGKIEAAERGAFKVANSWGNKWKNSGYIWVLYDALNSESQISTDWEKNQGLTGTRSVVFSDRYQQNARNSFYEIFVENKDVDVVAKVKGKSTHLYNLQVGINARGYSISYMPAVSKRNYATAQNFVMLYDYSDFYNDFSYLLGNKIWLTHFRTIQPTLHTKITFCNPTVSNFEYSLVDNKNNQIAKCSTSVTSFTTSQNIEAKYSKDFQINTNMKRGSVDFDSNITLTDANLVQKYALGILEPSNLQSYLADYNQDGKVDLTDAKAVLNVALGVN